MKGAGGRTRATGLVRGSARGRVLAGVLAMCLAGCGTTTWVKDNASFEDVVDDSVECERRAESKIQGSTPAARSDRDKFIDRCMTERGYVKQVR